MPRPECANSGQGLLAWGSALPVPIRVKSAWSLVTLFAVRFFAAVVRADFAVAVLPKVLTQQAAYTLSTVFPFLLFVVCDRKSGGAPPWN